MIIKARSILSIIILSSLIFGLISGVRGIPLSMGFPWYTLFLESKLTVDFKVPFSLIFLDTFLNSFFIFQFFWFSLILNKLNFKRVEEINNLTKSNYLTFKKVILVSLIGSIFISVFTLFNPCNEIECLKNLLLFIPAGIMSFILLFLTLLVPYLSINKFRITKLNLSIFLSIEFLIIYLATPNIVLFLKLIFEYGIYPNLMPFLFYVKKSFLFSLIYLIALILLNMLIFERIKVSERLILLTFLIATIILPFILSSVFYIIQSQASVAEVQEYVKTQENLDVQNFNLAVKTSDFQACSKVNYFMYKASCQYQVAAALNNYELCKEVSERGWKNTCFSYFAYKTGKTEYCMYIDEVDKYNREKCKKGEKSSLYEEKALKELLP